MTKDNYPVNESDRAEKDPVQHRHMESKQVTAAAVQMNAILADVGTNLRKAELLIDKAFLKGAEIVILPEFFPSGVAFNQLMLKAALPIDGKATELLLRKARQHHGMVGGSFLSIKPDHERYNTFVLAFPDGTYAIHDKDIPTMWENCYYRGGNDPGIIDTPLGTFGSALCWEFIRTRTAQRLKSKIHLLVGGSCWWTVPDKAIPLPFKETVERLNLDIMKSTPSRMARLLGVPVVHAAHAGNFEGCVPWFPKLRYRSFYLGETQIVDSRGSILSRLSREQGEDVITARLSLGSPFPSEPIPEGFWIPRLHPMFKLLWHYQNFHGRLYYESKKKKGFRSEG